MKTVSKSRPLSTPKKIADADESLVVLLTQEFDAAITRNKHVKASSPLLVLESGDEGTDRLTLACLEKEKNRHCVPRGIRKPHASRSYMEESIGKNRL